MNLGYSDAQNMLRETLSSLFQDECTPLRLRQAEKLGKDDALWRAFAGLGIPMLRVPEEAGGVGGGLIDAIIVAQEAARALAPVPVIESIVAMRLLAEFDTDAARALIERASVGEATIGLALAPAENMPDQIVPHAAGLSHMLLYSADGTIVSRRIDGVTARNGFAGSFDAPLSGIVGVDEIVGTGDHAVTAFLAGVEEWKLLQAAWLAAAGKRVLEIGAAYCCERQAFGRAIGSYQGLAHPMADSFVEVDGAELFALSVPDLIARAEAKAAAHIDLAYWFAGRAATAAAVKAMRAHGGYGISLEYDVQIYYRQIVNSALMLGDPVRIQEQAGARLWGGKEVSLPPAGEAEISFEFGAHAQAIHDEVSAMLADYVTQERRDWAVTSDDGHDPEFCRRLAERNLLYPDWPEAFGGRGADMEGLAAQRAAFADYRWPITVSQVSSMVGAMVYHFGTEEAKREILPRLASGEAYAALGYSEPSCGSDIFAARTTARQEGDEWLINGQKMWTSQGHIADYCLMLTRTGPEKHAGITLFVVKLDSPGYSFTGIETLEERTNATFYDDVRVHDRYRLGEINGGARVLAAALTLEQGGADFYVSEIGRALDAAVELASEDHGSEGRLLDRPDVRQRLAEVHVRREITDLLNRRVVGAMATGSARKYYGPATKLFGSETWLSMGLMLGGMLAPNSLTKGPDAGGRLERAMRASIGGTIYGGTSEVQRSIVAEDGLGLPRSRS